MANNRKDSEERICLLAVKSDQPQTAANLLSLPYKEGVAGSTQHRPLINYLQIVVRRRRLGGGVLGGQGRCGHDAPAGDRARATGRTLGKPTLPQFLESEPTGKTSTYKRTRQYRASEAEVPTQGGPNVVDEERRDRSTPLEDLYAEYTVYDMHYEKIGKIDDLFVDENDNPEYVGVKMGFLGPSFSDDREITSEFERQVFDYYRVETRQASMEREAYGAYYSNATGRDRVDLQPGSRVDIATGDVERRERPFSPGHEGPAKPGSDRTADENEIRVQRNEEELVAGTRQREAGAVNVRKRVRTDRERLSVPKKREEVSVRRVPVEEGRRPEAVEAGIVDDGDDEIRIPIIEEEIVVEKRPVVKEEIRLRKEIVDVEDRTTRRNRQSRRRDG